MEMLRDFPTPFSALVPAGDKFACKVIESTALHFAGAAKGDQGSQGRRSVTFLLSDANQSRVAGSREAGQTRLHSQRNLRLGRQVENDKGKSSGSQKRIGGAQSLNGLLRSDNRKGGKIDSARREIGWEKYRPCVPNPSSQPTLLLCL
jgi:hypothetical protein